MKTTLVIGASENPMRYSHRVVKMLKAANIPITAIGMRRGEIDGVQIQTGFPEIKNVDTVTLYVSAQNQQQYYHYILSLKPQRVIFNPGAENPEFQKKIEEAGIEVLEACTLTMLSIGNY